MGGAADRREQGFGAGVLRFWAVIYTLHRFSSRWNGAVHGVQGISY